MTASFQSREWAYLRLLHYGLVLLRGSAFGGKTELCRIESDHLHNVPNLLGESSEPLHVFYIVHERGLYLQRLRELGATEYLEQVAIWYTEAWQVLAAAAGMTLDE